MGFSKQLEQEIEQQKIDQLQRSVASIQSVSSQTYLMFEDLLGWTKTQTGKLNFKAEHLHLPSVLADSLAILDNMLQAKSIELNIDLQAEWLSADSYMLQTVLRNILTNAIKFLPHNGTLTVQSQQLDAGYIKISVLDNGPGMEQTSINQLLDPTFVNQGLGISLCQEFIALHNGQLNIESRVGKGTTVWFTIPKGSPIKIQKTNSNNEITAQKTGSTAIPVAVKEQIQPIVLQLEQTEIFNTTEILDLLQELEQYSDKNLQQWLHDMRNIVEELNEEKYNVLIQKALNE